MMTLDQLRVFVAVAQREHLTQAAHDLNLTQSAVSSAIASLENCYAVKLFNRVGRHIELTETGRIFWEEARAVLARASAAEAALADLNDLKIGSLNFAASQTVANYWLPPLMLRYRLLYPGIVTHLVIGNTRMVAQQVLEGVADLGFVEGNINEPALAVSPIAEDELALIVGREHPWATKGSVQPGDLPTTRWVFRECGSGTQALFEETLAQYGINSRQLDIVFEFPSNEAVCSAVASGAGAAVISKLAVRCGAMSGALVVLDFPLPKRQFFMLRHKERHTTRAECEFQKLVS